MKATSTSTPPITEAGPPAKKAGRVGGWISLAAGALLAGSMAYILAWEGRAERRPETADGAVGVAVFFPDRADWDDFRAGALAVAGRGLAKSVSDGDGAVTLEAPRSGRRVRFAWHGVGGLIETREEVRRLAESPEPPTAIIGSSNTLLTAALAEALRDARRATGRPGPVLLVPWATSILVEDPGGGPARVPLLGINPGRTFRFCANNRHLAGLVVGCLASREPKESPGRVVLVVDRDDSFSTDLADGFSHALAQVEPKAEVETFDFHGGSFAPAQDGELFVPEERALADRIWRAALAVPGHRPAWVVLPLQEAPTLRLIRALRGQVWWGLGMGGEAGPLRVLCGDGLRRETLQDLAATNDLPFPVWAVSNGSTDDGPPLRSAGLGAGQIPAEIASSLIRCLDAPGRDAASPDGLRSAMAAIDLKANDAAAFGRPLAFQPSGERRGDDLGHVLEIEPGRAEVATFSRRGPGRWVAARPPRPGPAGPPP